MEKIELKWIRLLNFKGVKDLRIDFSPNATIISGWNGTGKTTISDAIWWLLFGKNSQNQEKFDIKTLDSNGKIIYKIPHEVEGVISKNGKEIHLAKRITEKWKKDKNGQEIIFNGNEIERFYNDVPCTEKEYIAKITEICREEDFKYISNPYYFCSLDSKQQKAKLLEMAGEITKEDIVDKNPELKPLLPMLKDKTEDELKKEIKAKKNRIQSEITGLPDRIDENKRKMPEKTDWSTQEKELKSKKEALKKLEDEIMDIAKRNEAQDDAIREIYSEINQIRENISKREKVISDEANKDYFIAQEKWLDLHKYATEIQNEINGYIQKAHEETERSKRLSSQRDKLIEEWKKYCAAEKEIKSRQLIFEEDQFRCPTCHREFEPEDIENRQNALRDNFIEQQKRDLAEISRLKDENMTKGSVCSLTIINEIKQFIDNLSNKRLDLQQKRDQIINSQEYKEAPRRIDITAIVEKDSEILEYNRQIEGLKKKITLSAEKADISHLNAKRSVLRNEINVIEYSLRDKEIFKELSDRVKELESQYTKQSAMIEELSHTEYLLDIFNKIRNEEINKRIDGLFSIVKFRWVAPQINGGEKETCEATINGVPYNLSLNSGAKINAGLDIINAISKHIGITAPVIIDNAESVNELTETLGQRIIFKVSTDKKLKITNI